MKAVVSSIPLGTSMRECGKAISVGSSSAGKTAAKDIEMKATDVGKTVAIDAGKKLVEKAAKMLSTSKSQVKKLPKK